MLVGTAALNTSCFSSTDMDYIPAKIRAIFDREDSIDQFFAVFYMTDTGEKLARTVFEFKGRDVMYQERCFAEATGMFTTCIITYRGNADRFDVTPDKQKLLTVGEPFLMKVNGDIIP